MNKKLAKSFAGEYSEAEIKELIGTLKKALKIKSKKKSMSIALIARSKWELK